MRKAILIHGYHKKKNVMNPNKRMPSNNHWVPWASKQLMINGIFPIAVEMPEPWNPKFEVWKKELERFDIDKETILIGHSYGGGFVVRWLSETDKKIDKVILVAPYMGLPAKHIIVDQTPTELAEFFDFPIDRTMVQKTIRGVTILESTNDDPVIDDSLSLLKRSIDDLHVVTVGNRGHFLDRDMGTDRFPELIEEVLR